MSVRAVGEGKTGRTDPTSPLPHSPGRQGKISVRGPRLSLVCVFFKALWAGSEWDIEGPRSSAHSQRFAPVTVWYRYRGSYPSSRGSPGRGTWAALVCGKAPGAQDSPG